MKDELVVALIFVLLLGLFFFNSYAMESKTEKISVMIDKTETKIENNSLSYKDAQKLKKEWEKEKKILLFFLSHGTIEEIDECMELFLEYSKEKSYEEARHNLKKARHYLKDLARREKIRLDNIF